MTATTLGRPLPAAGVLASFLALAFLGPIVLGPLLFEALRPFHIPFHRAMNRALVASALIGLVIYRSRLPLRIWWPGGRIGGLEYGLGWLVALVSGQLMIGLYAAVAGLRWSGESLSHHLLIAGLAALIVPFLEETIFRGFLTTTCVEALSRPGGWVVAALIYALAHFLKVPSDFPGELRPVTAGAGAMAAAFAALGQGDFLGGRGLNLFLVGLVLGSVFLRLGRLWMSAGLHSGWIFILMTFTAMTRPARHPHLPWLAGSDLIGSPATSLVIVATGWFLWRYYPPRTKPDLPDA